MPHGMDVRHVSEHTLVHHVLHSLEVLAVTPLKAHLQHLLRMLRSQGAKRVHFLRLEDKALFAKRVLARLQSVSRHREMFVQRDGDDYRIDIFVCKQLAIIVVLLSGWSR